MSNIPPIPETQIEDFIVRAVTNVCTTMLKKEAKLTDKVPDHTKVEFKGRHIFGSVGFVGKANGTIYLCMPDAFAIEAASTILGLTADEVKESGDEVVMDVVGEITNMTVGGFKNTVCDVGYSCKLTLPTVVFGDNLGIAANKTASRYIFKFLCGPHELVTDIQLKGD